MPEKHSKIPSGFFVTGTDTGIGKTFVSRLLMDIFMKTLPVTYFKPVQTGCIFDKEGELIAPDFEYIMRAGVKRIAEYRTHVPYRFKDACSPHLAARLERKEISLSYISDCLQKLSRHDDHRRTVIAEGAGGVYTPLGKSSFMLDLMASLGLPVILVVSPKLGTLNHTVLSINAVLDRALRLAGVVMNDPFGLPLDFIYADNKEFVREMVNPVPFVHIPFTQLNFSSASLFPAWEDFCRDLLR